MRFFRGKRSVVGCDLGRGAVKLVQLTLTSKGWKVVHADLHELSPESADDDACPSPQAIQAAMQRAWIAGEPIAVGLQRRPAVVRHVELPPIPAREIREALRWEAKKATSLGVDDVIVDYLAGDVVGGAGERKMPVTMVAAERAAVEGEFRQYERAGLRVTAMDVNPVAFYHAAHRLGADQTGGGCVALVDIGLGRMDINIVKQGTLRFSRSIPMGGATLTQRLIQHFGIDVGQAEAIKREQGLSGKAKILEVLGPEVDRLIVEIQRSVDYYRAQSRDGALERMLLAGGTPLMPGFVAYISSFFDAKVALFNPFEGMDYLTAGADLEQLAPRYVSSVGLALRERA